MMMNYDFSQLEKLSSYAMDLFYQDEMEIKNSNDLTFKLAIKHFETLLTLFKDNVSNYYELFIYNKLGQLYYLWGKPLIAEKMFKTSLINYSNEETDLKIVADNLFSLSKIYYDFKDIDRSKKFLICSLFTFNKLEDQSMLDKLDIELEKFNITADEIFVNCKDKYWSMF